ncbi:MAG TPA: SDR family NAD(P)-dependent oxidoreductase [Longimicrobiales bacterium]
MTRIKDSVALVTGASYGLGEMISRQLAGRGARVALVARSRDALEALAQDLRAQGATVAVIPADLAERGAAERVVETAARELGPIDILINNAGIEHTLPYEKYDAAELDRIIDVNLRTPLHLVRLTLPGMLERKRGHVVNMASLAGIAAPAFHESYSATKAALIAFSNSLRASVRGSGVGVSVVVPGFVSEAGMHERMKKRAGVKTPALAGAVPAEKVVRAVMRALDRDLSEVLVTPFTTTLMTKALGQAKDFSAWIQRVGGVTEMYRRVATKGYDDRGGPA